jgi:hypothetical protein
MDCRLLRRLLHGAIDLIANSRHAARKPAGVRWQSS